LLSAKTRQNKLVKTTNLGLFAVEAVVVMEI